MDALWTALLDLVAQVVTPLWDTLLQYIPLLFLLSLPLFVLLLVWMWHRNSALNRSRVAQPAISGPTPHGVHLPPPSIWPFVAPIGLFLIFLGVVLGQSGGPNVPLVVLGVAVAGFAALGWFLDAGREYDATDAGDHHLLLVEETDGLEPVPLAIPEGIHLPPPSGWPFLAPIGLFFVFLGLVLSPVLIVGGMAMAAVAAVGWLRDAGKEYHEIEDGAHPDPALRDPERAFPKRLVPVYVGIGAVTVVLALAPWLLSLLPQQATAQEAGPVATTTPFVSASSVVHFDQRQIVVPAETPFTITFQNDQEGVPHNIWIYSGRPPDATTVFEGETVTGPATIEYAVPALAPGTWPFICVIHPPMTGIIIAK